MNSFLESKILSAVKENFPKFDWIEEPVQVEDDEENFCLDVESLNDEEEYPSNIMIVKDLDISPEMEISFQAHDETCCQVYTDKDGNIRSMLLDID